MGKPIRFTHRKLKDGTIKVVRTNTKKTLVTKILDKALKKRGR